MKFCQWSIIMIIVAIDAILPVGQDAAMHVAMVASLPQVMPRERLKLASRNA
jgi:hypothetical protein